MSPIFLVTSATGTQGGSTARILLSRGAHVNGLVRDPTSAASLALQTLGATLYTGDFNSLPAIAAATAGVTGIFLNTFPSFTDPLAEVRAAQNIVDAAKAAGTVTTVVVSTVAKASEQAGLTALDPEFSFLHSYYVGKAGVESIVKDAGFENVTVLRPDHLYYNYLAPASAMQFPEYRTQRVLAVSVEPEFRRTHFDPGDVGKFAAGALIEPGRFRGRTLELRVGGLTYGEVAEVLSGVAGVEVRVKFRSEEETEEERRAGTVPVLPMQLWAAKSAGKEGLEYDPKALDEFGIELRSLEEYLESEKMRLKETLGVI